MLKLNPRASAAQSGVVAARPGARRCERRVRHVGEAYSRNEPENPIAKLALARTPIARGDFAKAEAEMKARSRPIHPNAAPVRSQNGNVVPGPSAIFAANARKWFDQALAVDPKSFEATSGLIAADLASNKPDAAKARL